MLTQHSPKELCNQFVLRGYEDPAFQGPQCLADPYMGSAIFSINMLACAGARLVLTDFCDAGLTKPLGSACRLGEGPLNEIQSRENGPDTAPPLTWYELRRSVVAPLVALSYIDQSQRAGARSEVDVDHRCFLAAVEAARKRVADDTVAETVGMELKFQQLIFSK
jgi:hypothetical protein